MPQTIETDFDNAMENLYYTAKEKCAYNATLFLQMLHEHGGIETAHRLLRGEAPQYGFTKLWECGCLNLTVECLVLNRRFQELFDEHELESARQRLRDYEFNPDRCEQHE